MTKEGVLYLIGKDNGINLYTSDPQIQNEIEALIDYDFTIIPPSKPPIVNIDPNLKKRGNWKHSKTKQVMNEIEKILECKYVRWVQPISKTRQVNRNLLELENDSQIRLYIKDAYGTQIFIVTTTARNISENQFIIEKISEILPNFEKK